MAHSHSAFEDAALFDHDGGRDYVPGDFPGRRDFHSAGCLQITFHETRDTDAVCLDARTRYAGCVDHDLFSCDDLAFHEPLNTDGGRVLDPSTNLATARHEPARLSTGSWSDSQSRSRCCNRHEDLLVSRAAKPVRGSPASQAQPSCPPVVRSSRGGGQ